METSGSAGGMYLIQAQGSLGWERGAGRGAVGWGYGGPLPLQQN